MLRVFIASGFFNALERRDGPSFPTRFHELRLDRVRSDHRSRDAGTTRNGRRSLPIAAVGRLSFPSRFQMRGSVLGERVEAVSTAHLLRSLDVVYGVNIA